MPALPTLGRTRGRGILRLAAPPKVARVSARREPAQYFVPPPPWAFEVPPQPSVEFRVETPAVLDTPMEQGNRFPSTPDPFLDTDEDFRPLTVSWGDIMEQEDRAAIAAVPTVMTVPDMPVMTTVVPATTSAPTTTTMSVATTVATSGTPAPTPPIPLPVAEISANSPTVVSTVLPPATRATLRSPTAGTSATAPSTRPLLRFADVAYAVRLTPAGEPERVVRSLLASFQTERTQDELLFAVRAMYALLRDVGMFLRERVVLTHISDEPAQRALDDIIRFLDGYMGDDVHHRTA